MGHIRLSREADLVVVAPATADLMAKMAAGLADDLASTLLLASDKPVLVAPAMNPQMWAHPATRRNLARLSDGRRPPRRPEPGRHGLRRGRLRAHGRAARDPGRDRGACWRRPRARWRACAPWSPAARPASRSTRSATSSNHSSGRQGHAIAQALAEAGAAVTLVSGPVQEPDPPGVSVVACRDRRARCWRRSRRALPADIAVCAAAVADWRPARVPDAQDQEARRASRRRRSSWSRTRTSCARLAARRAAPAAGDRASPPRPATSRPRPRAKLARKGCDWILANDVSPGTGVFGGDTQPGPAADRRWAGARPGRSSTSWRWPAGWWRGSPAHLGAGPAHD